ncbi:helix-turn-helix transcriptional regulator [Lederbergia sp. NSJ-179]|uniref:helix-turn-helix domain-containing protein n=1 Tax=Lederbergia sp. NSJ-179 TaxID=2931402 RepID=UPI001FD58900|nr:helix-turn-helix transcriptional regulator [Lederbergia sp. NSJ-179]MCJ7842308.1 helix-turn-helix transcriptional regulator [Lederbergia sp. NSJ-179]
MKKNKNLLDMTTSMLKEGHSDLKASLEGLAPVYAKIIFARRMEFGYSQQELAKKANTGLKTISRAEGGFDNLSTETYDKIFHALDLKVRDVAEAMIQLQSGDDELAATSV